MAVKISKSRKRKLRQVRTGAWGNKAHRTDRNMKRRLDNLASMSPVGLQRPTNNLDKQAMDLGVYTLAYHCMPRKERKHIVSKAFSQRNAA